MAKALARAFRWRRMLDEGVCGTMEELAKREGANRGYMSRVLRLTLVAPDLVAASLSGRLGGTPNGTATEARDQGRCMTLCRPRFPRHRFAIMRPAGACPSGRVGTGLESGGRAARSASARCRFT
jgi:hypothetical protein